MTSANATPPAPEPEASRPERPSGGQFAAFATTSAITNVISLIAGFGGSILLARYLGRAGKGQFTFLMTISAVIFSTGNLGLGSAITYRVSRGLTQPAVAGAHAVILGLLIGLGGLGVTILLVPPENEAWSGLALPVILVALAMAPVNFVDRFLGRLLSALLKIHVSNALGSLRAILRLGLLLLLLVVLKWNVGGAVVATVGALTICTALRLAVVWRTCGVRLTWDGDFLKGAVSYGVLAYLLLLTMELVVKVDVFFVKSWCGDGQLGVYSVAAGVAQMFWLLPGAVTSALFPVAARRKQDRGGYVLTLCRLQVGLGLLGGPLLAAVAPLVIWVHGSQFMASLWPFYGLLPGILLYPIGKYLTVDLAARGNQKVPLLFSIVTLAIDLVLVVVLVPQDAWYGGIQGAAFASSVAYGFLAMGLAVYYARKTNVRLSQILVPSRSDLAPLKRGVGAVLVKMKARLGKRGDPDAGSDEADSDTDGE